MSASVGDTILETGTDADRATATPDRPAGRTAAERRLMPAAGAILYDEPADPPPRSNRRPSLFPRTINGRILAALLGVYIVTYVATAFVVYSGVRSAMLDSNRSALDQLADVKYERVVNTVSDLARNVSAWSELEMMNDLISNDVDLRVARMMQGLKRFYDTPGEIYAFGSTGTLVASSVPNDPRRGTAPIPDVWRVGGRRLMFIDKHDDPFGSAPIVAIAAPVFGSFVKDFHIGTLIVTYPWSALEKQLYSADTATILLSLGDRGGILAADPPGVAERAGFGPTGQPHPIDSDYVAGRSVERSNVLPRWQVITLQNTGVVTHSMRRVALELAVLGGALGLPIVLLVRWLSNRMTQPVVELTRVARAITDTDRLHARVRVTSADELGTLGRAFNRMTENLERASGERERFVAALASLNQTLEQKVTERTHELEMAVAAQRRLIGDISHEIKSPLARLSMAVGLARRAAEPAVPRHFERMESEVSAISALVGELLTLARLEGTGGAGAIRFSPIDLSSLVEEIVADALYERPDRTDDVTLERPDRPVMVSGDAALLHRGIENVVRNALFYTAPGVPVTVRLASGRPGFMVVTVADEGPGVPANAIDHLFEPFYRVDEARARETGGTGVGLAICQRVMRRHGGTVVARNATPHGLIIEMTLPLTTEPPAASGHDPARTPEPTT